MIPQKTIREEKFQGVNYQLQDLIREIPMTEEQNNRLHRLVDDLESIFREANE